MYIGSSLYTLILESRIGWSVVMITVWVIYAWLAFIEACH